MTTVKLEIPEIDCQGCLYSIRLILSQLNGTGKVDGDWKSHLVTVEFDPAVASVSSIQDALVGIGYTATVMEN